MAAGDPFSWMMGNQPSSGDPAFDEAVQANDELLRKVREREREFATLVHDVFRKHPRGAELLDHLRQMTIETTMMKATGNPLTMEAEFQLDASDWIFAREGQNSLVRMLEYYIRMAETPEEPAQQKEST